MNKAVVVIKEGSAEVMFQNDDINVIIINMDKQELFIYKNEFICRVTAVNDDGTVDLKCIDVMNESESYIGRNFMRVLAEELWFYAEETDSIDDDVFGPEDDDF